MKQQTLMNLLRTAALAALAAIPGLSCTYSVSVPAIPASGGYVYATVSTQAGCAWMVDTSGFLSYYSRSGVGTGAAIFYAQPDRGAARSVSVRVLESVQQGCQVSLGGRSSTGCNPAYFTKVVAITTAVQY
jgi:hypothetical protein